MFSAEEMDTGGKVRIVKATCLPEMANRSSRVGHLLERSILWIPTPKSTGIRDRGIGDPPLDAQKALASHFAAAEQRDDRPLGLSVPKPTDEDPEAIRGLGSPNTLRHTCHTWLQCVGVPQAQIDAAAGHSGEKGNGCNYTHLRPEYLSDFVEGVELLLTELNRLTGVHRRSQSGPKIITFGPRIKRAAA